MDAVYTNDTTKAKFGVLAREVFKKFKALMPDNSIYNYKPKRDAINAIYSVIDDNVEEADITAIVKQVQDVVDQSIESLNLALEPTEDYGKKIDISNLDFERIEKEFLKVEKKNTAVQSLKAKLEKQLNRMIDDNPLRIDFYEKYQAIIDEYNAGKDYATIEEIFKKLLDLYGQLNEEEKRSLREEMTEEELAVFDMLGRDKKITDKEKSEVKTTAKELLKRLQENEFKVDRWSEKVQTASAVRKAINDYLFNKLPYPTYAEEDITMKTDVLFNFFKQRYGDNRIVA